MRLSEWCTRAPDPEAVAPKVVDVLEATLDMLGAARDPACWVTWGDDPAARYLVFVPTVSGLLQIIIRVNVPGEGARASGKLIRWNRVQVGELGTEIQGGHRLVTFQVESQVINGMDADADEIAAFALAIFTAIDGRTGEVGSGAPGGGASPGRGGPEPVPPLASSPLPAPAG